MFMTKQEKELLKIAKEHKETKTPENFKSWLNGFRLRKREESGEFKRALDELV